MLHQSENKSLNNRRLFNIKHKRLTKKNKKNVRNQLKDKKPLGDRQTGFLRTVS